MQEVQTRLRQVQLYRRGATMTRYGTLQTRGTLAQVQIKGLPLALEDHSVRVRVLDLPEGAEVFVTGLKVGLHAPPVDAPETAELEQALLKARRVVARLLERKTQLGLESELLKGFYVPPRPKGKDGKQPPPSPIETRVILEQFTHEELAERIDQSQALDRKLKKAHEDERAAKEALRQASTAADISRATVRKDVVLQFRCQGEVPSSLSLELSYFVPGAMWAPSYQCRIDRATGATEIITRALISQRTGEDWRGVDVKLSTAGPSTWSELPKLASRRIGRAQQALPSNRGFRAAPEGAEQLFADFTRGVNQSLASRPALPSWNAPHMWPVGLESFREVRDILGDASSELRDGGRGEYVMMAAGSAPMDDEIEEEMDYDGFEDAELRATAVAAPAMEMSRVAPRPSKPPSAKSMAKRKRAKSVSRQDYGGGGGKPESELPTSFESLMMASPEDAQERGKLVVQKVYARYAQSLASLGIRATVHEIEELMKNAHEMATSVQRNLFPSQVTRVGLSAGVFDYVYEASAPMDVPSDGAIHSVFVHTCEAPCDLTYVAVPRVEAQVYRVAMIKNPGRAPMLAGPVEVVMDGEYVLTTTLPTVAPMAHFRLGLGVEQAVKCARNTHYEERRSGDTVVATAEHWHQIKVELVNRLPRPIRCEVRERIPQAAEGAEIVVEESLVEPAWEVFDQRPQGEKLEGGRLWKLALEPGQSVSLQAEYIVKVYIKNEVVGGNRREA